MPRLPPGVESGCSGFFLPRWSLRASAFVGGWRPPRPNSLFPAGRGRTEKGLRWEEGAGNWWGRVVPAAALGKAGIAAIRTGWVGDTAIATWACRFRGAHQDPFPNPEPGHTYLQQHAENVPADDEQFSRGRRHCRHGSKSAGWVVESECCRRPRICRGPLVSESAVGRTAAAAVAAP